MRQRRDGSVGCVYVGVGLSVVGSVDGVVNLDLSLLFPVFIVSRPLVAIPETFISYSTPFRTVGGDYCGDDCGDDCGGRLWRPKSMRCGGFFLALFSCLVHNYHYMSYWLTYHCQ